MTPTDDRGIGIDPEPGRPPRGRGLSPLTFVLVLTAVVMVFAILVAVWMYWLAGAVAV